MRGPEKLLENENCWETRMGGWFAGERVVYRGQDLHVDLGDMSWMELHLYGITGRRFTEAQLKILNAIWVYTSFPEPRIWNNRISTLTGTARSTATLSISTGIAVSEASIYGHGAATRAIDFLIRAKGSVDNGISLIEVVDKELCTYRTIYGYGRPIITKDERVEHFMNLIRKFDFDKGKHVVMSLEIEKILIDKKAMLYINYAGLNSAVLADMEFTQEEAHLFKVPCFIAGMSPCFIDAAEKHEGTFFPLRCNFIDYEGGMVRRYWNG